MCNSMISDPALHMQMRAFNKTVDPKRARDFDQLRYAMRSVFMNAPFIRNLIVVVNNKITQIPSWLDVDHPRIRVVELAEMWDDPADLPSMNSNAIEWATMNIPDIAPLYLLFNDDFALQKPLSLSSIWRGPKRFVLHQAWKAPTGRKKDSYGNSLAFVYQLFNKKYGSQDRKVASHIPILLDVKVMQQIRDDFPNEFKDMYRAKPFRTNRDMQTQFAYQQYVMHHYPHRVVAKKEKHVHFIPDLTHSSAIDNMEILRRARDKPLQYLCIQDDFEKNPTALVLEQMRGFYEELFPIKAPWEKDLARPSLHWRKKNLVWLRTDRRSLLSPPGPTFASE